MTDSDPGSASELPSETRVGRVALRVHDLDQLVEFYETVVGLEVLRSETEWAVLGRGEALLELIDDSNAPERSADETGLFHTAFRVPSRAALADALSRVQEHWQLDGASDHLVSEALYLKDPEDNGIEIYHDRPRAQWPDEDDGSVGMETLPLDLDEFRAIGQDSKLVPSETTIGHVHLEVSSLAASRAFYVDGLGMRVRDRYGDEALFVAAGEYHHHVGLNTWNGRSEPRAGRGLQWFELVLPDQETLDAVRMRFDRHGTAVSVTEEGITVTDPDGIELRLRAE
jgi:catechol 2,3-dioxygenase